MTAKLLLRRPTGARLILGMIAGAALAVAIAAPAAAQLPKDTVFVPGLRVGAVGRDTTPAALRKAYGARNVVFRQFDAGEGTKQWGALVFKGTTAEMRVFWHPGRKRVAYVDIGPDSRAWHTPFGVRVGMSAARVQQLNGRPFQIQRENDSHNCSADWNPDKLSKRMVLCFASNTPLSKAAENRITRYKGKRSALPVVLQHFQVSSIRVYIGRAIPRSPGKRPAARRNTARPPASRATLSRAAAARARCRGFGRLRSRGSNARIPLTFINRSGAYRGIQWLDFRGKPKTYANLKPGQRFTVTTFIGHYWMITDGPGNCLAIYLPRRGQKVIVIRPVRRRRGRK